MRPSGIFFWMKSVLVRLSLNTCTTDTTNKIRNPKKINCEMPYAEHFVPFVTFIFCCRQPKSRQLLPATSTGMLSWKMSILILISKVYIQQRLRIYIE